MSNSTPINIDFPDELLKEVDKLKDRLYNGNRTALILDAVRRLLKQEV